MIRILLMIMSLFPSFANSHEKLLRDVSELQWENRVLLIWSEVRPESSFDTLTDGIDERDLVWFQLSKTAVTSNYGGEISGEFLARTNKKYQDPEVQVMLIGKDGGIKNRYSSLDVLSVFKSIDAMPMRQSEIRNGKP
ncbi:DUF4174 domain-containing protein [Vibrio sp. WJH972]